MELNQDPIGVKSDGPTETMERRQEARENEGAGERQEVIGRETTAPLADAVNQLSTLLTRAKISDGAESAIPPFDGTYSATQFFQTFDRKMEDASMGEQEKLLRLPNYLVRQPLELFRKLRLADRSYFQVRQILLDLYPESSEASFAKYFAMKLTGQANLETYYREKNRHGIATRTSTRGDPRDADRRTAIQRPAPSPRSASREPRRVVPTGTADQRTQCTGNAIQRRSTTHNVRSVPQHTPTPRYMECTSSAVRLQVLRRETLAQRMPTSTNPDDPRKSPDSANGPKITSSDFITTKSNQRHLSRTALSRLRKVNELISSDVHPLPRIEDILDHLAQAKYFSTADISSAYWQVPIHPDSRPLLAFATFEGLYQPTRLPFGLKTSPQIYERAISQVLQRHGLDCVAHYFDDFIIYSNTLEEHQNHLRQFFAFCEAEKLQLNFAKCEFFKQSINFLGYTITAGTITPLTRNTDIIHAIKQPHNRKTLQSFLGAVNVYNKFIPEYARLRAPLNNLLKKDVVWNWNEACQEAFIDLKGNLTQHPILHLYKEGLPCQVYCDASTLGIAGILKQVHPDGNVYPVQYFSRTLRPHEKNYSISELECLAIVESVEKFRIYLMGRKFTIFSDHHALQWLKTIKNPSGRLFRWSLRLSSYEYEVRYIKGKLQYEADLLSRNPFCGFLDATLIKTHQSPPSRESSLTIDHNGLHTVSRKGVTKIILPKSLIQQLLQTVHTQYNHPGISQMSRIISTQYYWQGMSKDIKQKVKTCPTCQLTKRPVGPTYGELSQPPESKEPFDLLSLDTIAGFAKYGNTKTYLHVVVDHFSRYAWAFPSKSTSTTTYQQVLKRIFQDGSPKRLLTDRAPAFTSPKFRSFLLNRNIHPLLTTSNNPQANGLCERLNATLTGKLRLLHLENPKVAWTKLVKKVTLIYNKTPHSTTGFPPIYLMFGILPPEISNHNTPYPDIDKARKIAHTRTQNKHLQDKNTYDQRHKQPHFEVGDLVLVKLYHHPNTGKLAPYFTGPHTILEIISPNVVRIDRPNQPLQRDTDTIHVNKLKLYTEKIHYISPPAVSTYHIKHNPNYTFPFKHLTPELFPTESLRFKPTSSEPFKHLDPAIFATRRFTSLFPDVKNCKPDNQLNHITPLPKDIKQENCEPTNHSNSTIYKEVLIPNSLVTFRHGRGSIWVANGASWPQLIPSGMNMCTMESYEKGNICSLIESSDKLQETQLKSREWSQKINLTLDPRLSEIQRLQLVSCLDEFIDIFDFGSTPIKPTSTVKHKINTGDHSPLKQRPYRVAPSERRLIQDEVNKMIENYIVKPSESPWSPLENDQPSAVMSLTNVDIEQNKDPDLAKIIDNLNSGYTRKEFSIIDGILYKKNYSTTRRPWLMMIPKHLRSEVMADLHDAPTAGHLGFTRTYDKVKKRFYWPGLYRTVRQYVSHCRECQRRKKLPRHPAGQLVSIPPVEKPFFKVGVDLLGKFPVSKDGNRWIIVCTDYMTRYAITKVIPDGGTIETAKFLVKDVILKHGAPREMITDRGRNFISQVIKEINALCGIVHRFTTAYHPQTNGLTERFNKPLGDMLSMYTGVEQKDWDQVLPYVTFAHNTAKQEAIGYTPFFLVHAREAETYIDAILPYLPDEISDDYVGELVTRAEEARQLSRSRLLQSQAKDRRLYDQKHTPVYY
ncbi:hypothetical protein LAZ67_2003565 [Cordylochernes scorpioides]|uniref:RNA-directed DNA polymerase n=1 Tax=Cordylochernes scorpioides TaxID=51811 RepID=A0ABY6K389_9ARAC|nr:hypothetical protein LAZ67_2003565 [Cordylochernes scorpioides]